jgi:hypothetical protein
MPLLKGRDYIVLDNIWGVTDSYRLNVDLIGAVDVRKSSQQRLNLWQDLGRIEMI